MPTLPWFKFEIAEWMMDRNLSKCSPGTRGVWIDLIVAMHQDGRSGELRETTDELARLARTSTAYVIQALTELQTTGTADVTFRNNNVTIVNRRMKREAKSRTGTALRVMKHRSNKDVTQSVTGESKEERIKKKKEEEIFSGTWDDEKRKFFEDGGWQFKFSGAKNVKFDNLEALMKEFITDLELKQDYKIFRELQRHFTNWYNLKKEKGLTNKKGTDPAADGPKLKKLNGIH